MELQVTTSRSTIAPIVTTDGDFSASGFNGVSGAVIQGTAIYDIFWSRLDYMLGLSDKWMTCKESDQRVKSKIVWGLNETLCNSFNIKDNLPEKEKAKLDGK